MKTDFDNATESAERLLALRERAERFENLAADMAEQSQKDRLVMGEMQNALELAVATINRLHRHAPNSANGTLDTLNQSIAKAKTILGD